MHVHLKSTLRSLTAATILAAGTTAFTLPASAQVSFGVQIGRTPPPPLRYEVPPPAPGPEFFWQDGYWSWAGGRYIWIPGRYERRPYAGAYWSHPHWDHYQDGWHFHEGHWDREDHGDHHDWGQDRDHDRDPDRDHDRH